MRLNKYSHSFHPALSLVQFFSESVVPRIIIVSVLPGNLFEMQVLRPDPSPTESETLGWRPSHLWFKTPSRWLWRTLKLENRCSSQCPALNQSLELNFSDFTVLTNCMQNLVHGLVCGPYFEHQGSMLYCTSVCLQWAGLLIGCSCSAFKFSISESWEAIQF